MCFSSKKVARRSDQQKSEETIEMVKGAQAESSKMRYIDPAKTETAAAAAATTAAARYVRVYIPHHTVIGIVMVTGSCP